MSTGRRRDVFPGWTSEDDYDMMGSPKNYGKDYMSGGYDMDGYGTMQMKQPISSPLSHISGSYASVDARACPLPPRRKKPMPKPEKLYLCPSMIPFGKLCLNTRLPYDELGMKKNCGRFEPVPQGDGIFVHYANSSIPGLKPFFAQITHQRMNTCTDPCNPVREFAVALIEPLPKLGEKRDTWLARQNKPVLSRPRYVLKAGVYTKKYNGKMYRFDLRGVKPEKMFSTPKAIPVEILAGEELDEDLMGDGTVKMYSKGVVSQTTLADFYNNAAYTDVVKFLLMTYPETEAWTRVKFDADQDHTTANVYDYNPGKAPPTPLPGRPTTSAPGEPPLPPIPVSKKISASPYSVVVSKYT